MPSVLWGFERNSRAKHIEERTQEERQQLQQCYQECFENFERVLNRAEAEQKTVFVKEHSICLAEPTSQSRFLYGRNSVNESPWRWQAPGTHEAEVTYSTLNETPWHFPLATAPSESFQGAEVARAHAAEAKLDMTLHWTRKLYDWYTQHLGRSETDWPLVLDANDVMTEPQLLVRFAEMVGLDPTKLRFTWPVTSKEEVLAQLPGVVDALDPDRLSRHHPVEDFGQPRHRRGSEEVEGGVQRSRGRDA
ncbi:MAG: hypothetical protein M1816_007017 [Peltula sp. TS41687]|nr:MAG: hypothetical protein M1816_007017 [Peltula sp. TS41687]